jgi:flagellar biosynthetic protein FliR
VSSINALFTLVPMEWVAAVLLLSMRIGAALLSTPVFSAADVPVRVRVLIVLGLSGALCGGLGLLPGVREGGHDALAALVAHPLRLFRAALGEVALGIVMGLAIHAAFSAFALAGGILDVQLGFGLSQVFDPATNRQSPALTIAFTRMGVVMFFLLNGHHALVRAIAFSLERFPLAVDWSIEAVGAAMLGRVAAMFGLCVALVAPVMVCILLTEMVLGVLARNLPQVNMLTMGIPVKIVVGLTALFVWFSSIGPAMDRVYRGLYEAFDAGFAAGAAPPARAEGF